MTHIEQISHSGTGILVSIDTNSPDDGDSCDVRQEGSDGALDCRGRHKMLGVIAAILIVLWLLGFFAFHVSSAMIHVLLVIGVVLLVMHFFRGRQVTV